MIERITELMRCFKENGWIVASGILLQGALHILSLLASLLLWLLIWGILNIALSSVVLWVIYSGNNFEGITPLMFGVLTFGITIIGSSAFSCAHSIITAKSRLSMLFLLGFLIISLIGCVILHTVILSPTVLSLIKSHEDKNSIALYFYIGCILIGVALSFRVLLSQAQSCVSTDMSQIFGRRSGINAAMKG